MRKQNGTIIRIGDRWYVRYWERRNTGSTIERKRVTHMLGSVTTRGKHPPADIKTEAERHMTTVNSGTIPAERIVTVGDFVSRVYLPWIEKHKRPSTAKGYRDIWEDHLQPRADKVWLKDVRTYTVQGWLDDISKVAKLSRNSLKHVKSVVSAVFTLAKQQDYFAAENPPGTPESILGLRSRGKPMLTRWRKCRTFSRCCQSLQRQRSQWPLTWGCDTARSKGCSGKTTTMARCTLRVRSGTVV